ncbi:MAG: preprotein translocase subunit SecE [Bacteroidales bacterium]|nr:preprotein translocase subunit SecE [Porphyromonas sp.]MDD6933983.1 preprotein translocase subunit SecE [Bacteroidales bacterium]MDY3101546.1 preprotein translocase subunit SecE [Porphyromonas sp.]
MKFFNKIGKAFKESFNELAHKVSWPTRSELTSSAVVVMIASIIIALCIFAVDTVFNFGMEQIYKLVI